MNFKIFLFTTFICLFLNCINDKNSNKKEPHFKDFENDENKIIDKINEITSPNINSNSSDIDIKKNSNKKEIDNIQKKTNETTSLNVNKNKINTNKNESDYSKINENIEYINFNIDNIKIKGKTPGSKILTYYPKSKDNENLTMSGFCQLLYKDINEKDATNWNKWIRSISILTKKHGMDYYGFSILIKNEEQIKISLKADKTVNKTNRPLEDTLATIDRFDEKLKLMNRFNGIPGGIDQFLRAKQAAKKANKLIDYKYAIAFNNPSNTVRIVIPLNQFPSIMQFSEYATDNEIKALGQLLLRQMEIIGYDKIERIEVNCERLQTVAQLHFRIIPKTSLNFEHDIWLGRKIV